MKNDHLKAAGKKKLDQGFNGIRTRDLRDTGAMLYKLSYEATHWERGQLNEFISSREEWNDVEYILHIIVNYCYQTRHMTIWISGLWLGAIFVLLHFRANLSACFLIWGIKPVRSSAYTCINSGTHSFCYSLILLLGLIFVASNNCPWVSKITFLSRDWYLQPRCNNLQVNGSLGTNRMKTLENCLSNKQPCDRIS